MTSDHFQVRLPLYNVLIQQLTLHVLVSLVPIFGGLGLIEFLIVHLGHMVAPVPADAIMLVFFFENEVMNPVFFEDVEELFVTAKLD